MNWNAFLRICKMNRPKLKRQTHSTYETKKFHAPPPPSPHIYIWIGRPSHEFATSPQSIEHHKHCPKELDDIKRIRCINSPNHLHQTAFTFDLEHESPKSDRLNILHINWTTFIGFVQNSSASHISQMNGWPPYECALEFSGSWKLNTVQRILFWEGGVSATWYEFTCRGALGPYINNIQGWLEPRHAPHARGTEEDSKYRISVRVLHARFV